MYCNRCGSWNEENNYRCVKCGQVVQVSPPVRLVQPTRLEDDAFARAALPVGRTGLSIAAGYAGLASVLLWPLGPLAILLGVLAIRELKRKPGRLGMSRACFGLGMGIATTAGLVVLVVLKLVRA